MAAAEEPPAIPADWDDVTAAWVTSALRGTHPDAVVGGVTLLLRDDGTNRRARFGVTYERGSGPATVFLKASDPAHAALNAATGGVLNEPRLFLSGVSLPVEHPLVHLSLLDEPTLDFLLVMEDVTARGGDPRDATRPYDVEQAANGVRALARLHSAFWHDRFDAHPSLAWVEPLRAWRGMGRGIDIGMERAGSSIPAAVRAMTGDEIEEQWVRFVDVVGDGPATLLHGDAHIGNTYVLPDDEVGFLDWQVVRRGSYSLDLGYFLQGAVTIEDRRSCEADLVHEYVVALDLAEADTPTEADVWLRYRASTLHGLALWLATAASRWQRREVSLSLAERYAAAFVDLDALAALDELGV